MTSRSSPLNTCYQSYVDGGVLGYGVVFNYGGVVAYADSSLINDYGYNRSEPG